MEKAVLHINLYLNKSLIPSCVQATPEKSVEKILLSAHKNLFQALFSARLQLFWIRQMTILFRIVRWAPYELSSLEWPNFWTCGTILLAEYEIAWHGTPSEKGVLVRWQLCCTLQPCLFQLDLFDYHPEENPCMYSPLSERQCSWRADRGRGLQRK